MVENRSKTIKEDKCGHEIKKLKRLWSLREVFEKSTTRLLKRQEQLEEFYGSETDINLNLSTLKDKILIVMNTLYV